jgi:hypothetical protein
MHGSPTGSLLSFGMFLDTRRKKLQYTTLPSFLIMAMNSVPYGRKEIEVKAEEIRLLRFVTGCAILH